MYNPPFEMSVNLDSIRGNTELELMLDYILDDLDWGTTTWLAIETDGEFDPECEEGPDERDFRYILYRELHHHVMEKAEDEWREREG